MYDKNEILGFETDTVWGMGCHPLNKNSVEKIYQIKGRNVKKPLILMSSDIRHVVPYIKKIPDYGHTLIKKYFPGALTLIFEKEDICPDFVTSGFNTIGVRIPNHKGFYGIAENFEGKVLATTSLNYSNQNPVADYNEAKLKFGSIINVIKPEIETNIQGIASTVVLCTKDKPVILRQGNIFI